MTVEDSMVSDLPQFYETLSTLSTQCTGLEAAIDKVLEHTQDTNTSQGVSLLQLKNQTLVQYLLSLSVLMLNKVEGKEEIDEAVWPSIVARTTIERIRPLEQKIQYQIDKLLKSSTNTELSYKPDLDELESSGEEEGGEDEKYRAPRVAATHYHEPVSKQMKKKGEETVKLGRGILQELQSEMSSTPAQVSHANPHKQDKRSRDRQEYEEEHFVRMTNSKQDKKKQRVSSGFNSIMNFDDEEMIRSAEKERGGGGGLKKGKGKKGKKGKKKFKSGTKK